MTDYSELKPLLDACLEEKNNNARSFRKACDALFNVCTIEMIAGLVADNDALRNGANFRAIQSLRQDCAALRKALAECTASLEGEVLQKFHGQKPKDMHPVTRREYDRDMAEISGFKALSKEATNG